MFSAKENISDDASGILMEAVFEGMAEYYSTELSQKIKRGMRILGYKIKDKQYIIDIGEETAPFVKKFSKCICLVKLCQKL